MKIIKENSVELSKRLTESNSINENESIEEMVGDILFPPICEYLNDKFRSYGLSFVSEYVDTSDMSYIFINSKQPRYYATPFIALQRGNATCLSLVREDEDEIYAYSLSEMCKIIEDEIIKSGRYN